MTLLIRNVLILGGAREFQEPLDLFVSGERISAIGHFPNKKADVVLDGQSAYLSPGFIDVNTDSDHYLSLFEHPGQEDFVKQGVTTIFGGMCGASLAPLLYGSLESIGKWTDPDKVNVNWHTMAEFLGVLDHAPLAVNFGTLAGHGTIRRAIVGESLRPLTKNEQSVFARTLRAALIEGAFGMSSGLAYVHARQTPYAELKAFTEIVKEFNGVYATHLRDTGKGVAASMEETARLAKETGVRTLVSHFVPLKGAEKEYEAALAEIAKLPPEMDFDFDAYLSASTLLPIYTFLPDWAQNGGVAVMLANVNDEWFAKRAKDDMPHLDEEHFIVAQAPHNDFLVGKSLKDIKEMYGLADGREALLRLMRTTGMRGGVLYRNVAADLVKHALASPRSLVASNAPSFAETAFRGRQVKSERTTRTFVDFLRLVEREHMMPLKDAIAKLTAKPAAKFGLKDRGTIAEGYYADLACFKEGEIRFVVVNGTVTAKDGSWTGARAGKALRHPAS